MRSLSSIVLALVGLLPACAEPADDAREAEIVSVIARADASLIRVRPELVSGKYLAMASDLHSFHRGSLAIFRHDYENGSGDLARSEFALDLPLVLGTGDPHFENFGVLVASDGSLAIEPNDFDAADRMPFLWDLRRLSIGMVIAAHVSNPNAPAVQAEVVGNEYAIARAVAEGYAAAIEEQANGQPRQRFTAPQVNPILADALERSEKDLADREELDELTTLDGNTRRLLRGVPDPSEPTEVMAELPDFVFAALPATLAAYRTTLLSPPGADYFTLLDAVRIFGRGVASQPRVRIFLLVRGPSDEPTDDVILELRELADSGTAGWYPPGEYFDTIPDRILTTSRAAWAIPDAAPLWGTSELLGLPVQVRWETEGQKTLRVARLVGNLGTLAALQSIGTELGRLLARVHATPTHEESNPARAIATRIGANRERFLDEQASVAVSYAAREREDFVRFGHALERLGPTLGIPISSDDAPTPELRALYGTPP